MLFFREETGYLQMSFKFSITEIDQEGLYSIFFHNCQVRNISVVLK